MRPRPARGRRALLWAPAAAVAVLLGIGLLLPPKALVLRQPEWRPAGTTWRGAIHVHTNRSDGTGTIDEVAKAASRAGLDFVVLTDHGDGTRPPEPPAYRSGVLVLDGVEIGTSAGHYLAIGMTRAPYPLGGDARDVVEDVARLAGFGVIAHPDSAKDGQGWQHWDLPADGIEWLNTDSQWRDESGLRLARAVLTYPFRPAETLASQLNQGQLLARWDRAASSRPLVALAGADAHARIGLSGGGDPYEGRPFLAVPSYEASFRAFSLQLVTPGPRSGRAEEDARAVLASLRAGRLHTVIDGWATPAIFEFSARGGGIEVAEGGEVRAADPMVMHVRSNAPLYAAVVLLRDGVEVHRVDRQSMVYATDRPGRYRVEIWLGRPGKRSPIPWLVSNAITLRKTSAVAGSVPGGAEVDGRAVIPEEGQAGGETWAIAPRWHVEHDPRSTGELIPATERPGESSMRFRLGPGTPAGQFAALVTPVRLDAGARAIVFSGQALEPMRVSVQLRAPSGLEGERWRRSVYLDNNPREVRVALDEMTPAGPTRTHTVSLPLADNLLFVVDTVNTAPGTAGEFTVSGLRVEGESTDRPASQ